MCFRSSPYPRLYKVFTLFLLLVPISSWAQENIQAFRIEESPRIDGMLTEDYWQDERNASIKYFVQRRPNNGQPSNQQTLVQVAYDNKALYIGARMFDTSPDSIQTQLGQRDQWGQNADELSIYLDPYNQQNNGFQFAVSASGVQRDLYISQDDYDPNWDAVWRSAVQVDSLGWTLEIAIPYSSLRFPKQDVQVWGINIRRIIARYGDDAYWNPVDANINSRLAQMGTLTGLENIRPPLRLSALPFISSYYNHQSGQGAFQMAGGMDLKYGVNESFTLDVSLVPDFGQVRSDNVVLNLSPFEVRFAENRPFFTEGTELFNQGDLFYSRRVGSTYGFTGELGDDELLTEGLPNQAPMLNATKFSGRTRKGTGIGVFNSLTNRTLVTALDTVSGVEREVQADPLTNYNVFVLDQNLPNNSRVSVLNTNVMRSGEAIDANVTGTFFSFFDKNNTWNFSGSGVLSQRFGQNLGEQGVDRGYAYRIRMAKVSGRWRFNLGHNVESDNYNINDLGFLRAPNEVSYDGELSYRINEPFGIFNRVNAEVGGEYQSTFEPREYDRFELRGSLGTQFRNQWSANLSLSGNPIPRENHFEPRTAGYVFTQPESHRISARLRTDRRKALLLSVNGGLWRRPAWDQLDNWLEIEPRIRFNEHLSLSHSFNTVWRRNERGYVNRLYNEEGQVSSVVIGQRDIQTLTNTLSGSYNFNALMGMTLRVRHYWSQVAYQDAYGLRPEGSLFDIDYELRKDDGTPRHDRNFNAFTVDLVYQWQFAPGSMLTFVWKNSIFTDDPDTTPTFVENLEQTLVAPQLNSFSVRVLYFLDYQDVSGWLKT